MTRRPGRVYPIGATYQPWEQRLEMTPAQLTTLRDVSADLAGRRGVHRFDDFIVYNELRKRDLIALVARGRVHQARTSLVRRVRAILTHALRRRPASMGAFHGYGQADDTPG